MTTKNKKSAGNKRGGKLSLKKETFRDLSAGDKGRAVRGGGHTGNAACALGGFGTLA